MQIYFCCNVGVSGVPKTNRKEQGKRSIDYMWWITEEVQQYTGQQLFLLKTLSLL